MKYVYTYDKNNNITNIMGYENNVLVYQEDNTYDIYNQLIMQYVLANGKEIVSLYLYDSRGNILNYNIIDARTEQILYGYDFFYSQTGNKNKLVKMESITTDEEYNIEYSTNGEPSLYLGWTIAYDMKNITTILNNNYVVNYTYNANGIRVSKVVTKNNNTTSTEYILDGTNIIKEIRSGQSNETLQYFYDSNDEIVGFTYNNVKYLYLKNLQKDIIGIVDSNNNVVVKYYYNAYGRVIDTIDTSGINLSTINPFRYRGYYQDNETGWYYLNSRYYDVETFRFITMDDVDYIGTNGNVISYNLYSYCENNPVSLYDKYGTDAKLILDFDEEGLIIFGHIALIVQDSSKKWHLIEYTGSKKSNAKVYIESGEGRFGKKLSFKKRLLSVVGLGGWRTLYIKGDFTKSLEYAKKYVGTNYGGYNLIFNNCLHFVKNALRQGTCSNALLQLYFKTSLSIVPRIFFDNAFIVSNMKFTILNKNKILRGYYA